jgi:hypothetical protein
MQMKWKAKSDLGELIWGPEAPAACPVSRFGNRHHVQSAGRRAVKQHQAYVTQSPSHVTDTTLALSGHLERLTGTGVNDN